MEAEQVINNIGTLNASVIISDVVILDGYNLNLYSSMYMVFYIIVIVIDLWHNYWIKSLSLINHLNDLNQIKALKVSQSQISSWFIILLQFINHNTTLMTLTDNKDNVVQSINKTFNLYHNINIIRK